MREQLSKYAAYIPCGIAIFLFGLTLTFGFVLFDDDLHVFRNPVLMLPLSEAVTSFWTNPYKGFYIPVTYTIWAVLVAVTKLLFQQNTLETISALLFHAMNVLLHSANGVLLYHILKKLTGSSEGALFGAVFFIVHPLQVESVAWVTGMKDLVAVFFVFLAIERFLSGFGPKNRRDYLIASILYLLALLCKPSVASVPLVLAFLGLFSQRQNLRVTLLTAGFWLAISAPFGLLTASLQKVDAFGAQVAVWQRPFVAADAFLFYLRKLVFPFSLIQDYSRHPHSIMQTPGWWVPLVLILFVFLSTLYFRKWKWAALLSMFFILLFPVSGIVPFAFQKFSTVADHYMYLPLLVPALALASMPHTRRSMQFAWLMICFLGLQSMVQVRYWQNTESLFAHTLELNPKSIIAHNNMAVHYEGREQLERSLYHYRKAVTIAPNLTHHRYNLGNVLLKVGELREAREWFLKTLELDPSYSDAHFNLGLLEESEGKFAQAFTWFEKSVESNPLSAKGHIKAGAMLVKLGEMPAGILRIERGLELDPFSVPGYFNLGIALHANRDVAGAKNAFHRVLSLNPQHEQARLALHRLN